MLIDDPNPTETTKIVTFGGQGPFCPVNQWDQVTRGVYWTIILIKKDLRGGTSAN